MPNQEETTAESQQTAASQEVQNQEQSQAGLETQVESQPDDSIPEKFIGKSPLDIIKSYNEVEKSYSKVASERAQERKAREEWETKYKDLESRFNLSQTQTADREESKPEVDPFTEYDAEFENDPKKAIKSLIGKTQAQLSHERQLMAMEAEQRQATDYYNTQKKDNQDFAKLEPTMIDLAKEYGDLVDPRKVNSVKALKLLHLAARGAKIEDYLSEARSAAKKETTTIRDEKRQAYSEGPSSKSSGRTKFEDLSVTDMEKVLGIHRS